MGLFDRFAKKQLEKHMESGQKRMEELLNIDRSDTEAMHSYLEKTQTAVDAKMPEWIKNSVSPEQRERIAKLQRQAIAQQAEVYRKLQDKKE